MLIAITLLTILLCYSSVYFDWRKSKREIPFKKFLIESFE